MVNDARVGQAEPCLPDPRVPYDPGGGKGTGWLLLAVLGIMVLSGVIAGLIAWGFGA